jgi:hypothetical protein
MLNGNTTNPHNLRKVDHIAKITRWVNKNTVVSEVTF